MDWVEIFPGRIWYTPADNYVIIAVELPEREPTGRQRTVYQARWVSDLDRRAFPGRFNCGILLDESPWCRNTDDRVHSAEAICDRHAWALARPGAFNVPDNTPAAALSHFWWPTNSEGHRGALAIVWQEGRLVAQVLGMSRKDDTTTEAAEFAQIDLTALGVRADPRDVPTLTEHLPQCGGCGAKSGSPHGQFCDHARCLVTAGQRTACRIFGDAPAAGMLTVATGGSQDEFETYFRNDAGHDCGQDIYQG